MSSNRVMFAPTKPVFARSRASRRDAGVSRGAGPSTGGRRLGHALLLVILAGVLVLTGCEREEVVHPVPPASEIATYYVWEGGVTAEISGNVAQVSVTIDPEQYRRGGDLWAKAFPYLFIFSPATRDALSDHPGLGGVRVTARHPNGDAIATAMLSRGTLTPGNWNRALSIARDARQEGTERPGRVQDLVRWGEDHTDFEYNPDYIRNP